MRQLSQETASWAIRTILDSKLRRELPSELGMMVICFVGPERGDERNLRTERGPYDIVIHHDKGVWYKGPARVTHLKIEVDGSCHSCTSFMTADIREHGVMIPNKPIDLVVTFGEIEKELIKMARVARSAT